MRLLAFSLYVAFLLSLSNFSFAQPVFNSQYSSSVSQNNSNNTIPGGVRIWQTQSNVDAFGNNTSFNQPNINRIQTGLQPANALTGSETDLVAGCHQWLEFYHPGQQALFAALTGESVIDVKPEVIPPLVYDHTGKVLNLFSIPHITIHPKRLKKCISVQTKIIILNGKSGMGSFSLNKDTRLLINNFVYNGGYLIASANACNTVEKIFPNHLVSKVNVNFISGGVTRRHLNAYGNAWTNFDIEPAPVNSDLLLGCPLYSEMQCAYNTIQATSPEDIVLLVSQWQARQNQHSNIGAMVFNFGKGKVLCYPGLLDPASSSKYFSPLAGPSPPVPFAQPQSWGSHTIQNIDYHNSPKQIGAAQFLAINFILQKFQDSQSQTSH